MKTLTFVKRLVEQPVGCKRPARYYLELPRPRITDVEDVRFNPETLAKLDVCDVGFEKALGIGYQPVGARIEVNIDSAFRLDGKTKLL